MFRSTQPDQTIRNVATAKQDTKILAIVSRELVAAVACYHKSCYRNYTRPMYECVTYAGSAEDKEYNLIESGPTTMIRHIPHIKKKRNKHDLSKAEQIL